MRNRRYIGVWAWLSSHWYTGALPPPVFWFTSLKQHHRGCPDESSTPAGSNTNIYSSEPLALSDQSLLHPTNAVWVAESLKHWTCFSIHPVVWIQLNNKPLTTNSLVLWLISQQVFGKFWQAIYSYWPIVAHKSALFHSADFSSGNNSFLLKVSHCFMGSF